MTSSPGILISHLNVNQAVLIHFIAVYSRLEFALKRANYCSPKLTLGDFVVDWDRFEREMSPSFIGCDSADVHDAVNYLHSKPPKKEFWTGASVDWKDVEGGNPRSLSNVMAHVRRARNNLFHGGKFATAPDDPARNEKVLRAGISILDKVIQLSEVNAPDVYNEFHSPNY